MANLCCLVMNLARAMPERNVKLTSSTIGRTRRDGSRIFDLIRQDDLHKECGTGAVTCVANTKTLEIVD